MRPPVCTLCDKFIDPDDPGDLVDFKKTAEDLQWDDKINKGDFIGHPPYSEWFCGEHIHLARKYQHHERREAIQLIKNEFKNMF